MRLIIIFLVIQFVSISVAEAREITDSLGRNVVVPDVIQRVICSGSGCREGRSSARTARQFGRSSCRRGRCR